MPMEEESDSISARTRSQNPIVILQEANNIFHNFSSSSTSSGLSDFEDSDIEQTEQYNLRALQFLTMTTTTDNAMALSLSSFDTDLLYIFTDVLKINNNKKPLHPIPDGLLHYGINTWEDFYVLDPIEISTFTYLTNGNTRTNLPLSVVIKLQFLLNLMNKRIDGIADTDSHDAKSYNAADFKVWFEQSWELKRDTSAAARAT